MKSNGVGQHELNGSVSKLQSRIEQSRDVNVMVLAGANMAVLLVLSLAIGDKFFSVRNFQSMAFQIPEFGFMAWYYMLSNPFRAWKMIPIAISLFRHGRLSIKARRLSPGGIKQLRLILEKAKNWEA